MGLFSVLAWNRINRSAAFIAAAIAFATLGCGEQTTAPAPPVSSSDSTSTNSTPAPPVSTAALKPDPVPGTFDSSIVYQPRQYVDCSGFGATQDSLRIWPPNAPLSAVSQAYERLGFRALESLDAHPAGFDAAPVTRIRELLLKASLHNYEGESPKAYAALLEARAIAAGDRKAAQEFMFTIVYFQGVTALRMGEDANCIMCRGESSCIIPIAPAAVHTDPAGSKQAIAHFTEYLRQFPDDLTVRWLINLAHMTLGEHPLKVEPKYLVNLDKLMNSEFNIGRFRDVGHLVGVNRFNQAGGACMDDFDGDGLFDLVVTDWDYTKGMAVFRNTGRGTFEDITAKAGVGEQRGGLNLVQGDFNNDGKVDLFIPRGAWLRHPVRPSLLQNNGDSTFTDVTDRAGVATPVTSNSAAWGDYDNDGHLDLFIACEAQPNILYRNMGDGTFREVTEKAGLYTRIEQSKGANWLDYDNDGYPDLFVNNMAGIAHLYRNQRDGTFVDVSAAAGIQGPRKGFSSWAWDYDNDGFLDIFATCYDRNVDSVIKGLLGEPHGRPNTNKLYRNVDGKRFTDATNDAGLDVLALPMGTNYGDLDNDGYLDFYLGTGEPALATLIPNRMFKNVAGKRFAEITTSSGTGHLQKGHGVAIGDWDRDGDADVFIETGGAINGDRYHNVLFQNPGQGNNWLSIKLVGTKTNRSAIGARIKVVTQGSEPLTIHRHVSSGSSFGASPLEQHIGLGKAKRVALVEIHWPTSGTTQTFRDVEVNQGLEIVEFEKEYRTRKWTPIVLPKEK